MQDHELYRRILGIEAPWQVERVELGSGAFCVPNHAEKLI
jgi:hypothetical protein